MPCASMSSSRPRAAAVFSDERLDVERDAHHLAQGEHFVAVCSRTLRVCRSSAVRNPDYVSAGLRADRQSRHGRRQMSISSCASRTKFARFHAMNGAHSGLSAPTACFRRSRGYPGAPARSREPRSLRRLHVQRERKSRAGLQARREPTAGRRSPRVQAGGVEPGLPAIGRTSPGGCGCRADFEVPAYGSFSSPPASAPRPQPWPVRLRCRPRQPEPAPERVAFSGCP